MSQQQTNTIIATPGVDTSDRDLTPIHLVCTDDRVVVVPKFLAQTCVTLKEMLEDVTGDEDSAIPSMMDHDLTVKIFQLLAHYAAHPIVEGEQTDDTAEDTAEDAENKPKTEKESFSG